jgi:hypothetical protein
MRSLMTCTAYHILLRRPNPAECDGRGTKHIMGTEEVYTGFQGGNLRQTDHVENPGVNGTIILRCIFRKWDWGGGGGTEGIDLG